MASSEVPSETEVPGVRIVGRTEEASGGPKFAWPGVHFIARFSGTQASVHFKDGSNQNRFTAVVDNGTPTTFTTVSGQEIYPVASGLPDGTHELVVWRNTESYKGVTQFVGIEGFSGGGALLAPQPAPERRIEMIGDSITVGSGVEGPSASCVQDDYTNNYLAYGSIAGRSLDADVVTIAYSGIGVYRSCCDSTTEMPDRYDYAVDNDKSSWDFSKYQPDAVVINLGTNDFSGSQDPGTNYETAYVNFVQHVHSKYPNAGFFLVIQSGTVAARVNAVATALRNMETLPTLEVVDVSAVGTWDSCGHPSKSSQQAMADKLIEKLRSSLGW